LLPDTRRQARRNRWTLSEAGRQFERIAMHIGRLGERLQINMKGFGKNDEVTRSAQDLSGTHSDAINSSETAVRIRLCKITNFRLVAMQDAHLCITEHRSRACAFSDGFDSAV
jgi:hypothetical protein